MKSWGIFEKLVLDKEPIFYPTFLQRMPFAQILRQRKISTVAGCLSIDAKMWQ
jgi:hypothetical protein